MDVDEIGGLEDTIGGRVRLNLFFDIFFHDITNTNQSLKSNSSVILESTRNISFMRAHARALFF